MLLATAGWAQKPANRPALALPDDVAALKQKADAGNVAAQLGLAEKLMDARRPADALSWYVKLADKGNVEASYRLGELLLFGTPAMTEDQRVIPRPQDGVRWTYRAATNFHARACRNMSRILQTGTGIGTNAVQAYAWLLLFAERDQIVGRHELNNLALRMETRDIQEAQRQAKRFKGRQWPPLVFAKTVHRSLVLHLEGVTLGGREPLAVINGRTLALGESAQLPTKDGQMEIKCVAIEETTVTVQVIGEDEPRVLEFDTKVAVGNGR